MRKGFLFLFLLLSVRSFATGQILDKIIYEGNTYNLLCNPLEKYFDQFPEKRPNAAISSTTLWRGYIATFEISGTKLYLKDITIEKKIDSTSYRTKRLSVFKTIFGNIERFDCDFYNGLLALPNGEMVDDAQKGFGPTYENYTILEINQGNLIKSKSFDYKGYNDFREKQFAAYKKTDDYQKQLTEMEKMFEETNEMVKSTTGYDNEPTKPLDTEAQVENFIKIFIVDYTVKFLE